MTRKEKYFVKQKLNGLAVIIFGIIASIILGGDATFLVVNVPIGLGLIFTKRMIIMDDYYYEIMERKERRR